MKIFLRKLHRWLGLLMALQIVAWMLSGFYFSLFPIAEIRGEHLTQAPQATQRSLVETAPAPRTALEAVDRHLGRDWTLESLRLESRDGLAFWRVEGTLDGQRFVRLADAASGDVRPALSDEQALARAQALLRAAGSEARVEWLEGAPDNLEFRGRPLPVWQVSFAEPENLRLYLEPWSGEVLAARTDRWRLFDFLWMLHIMDYDMRDDFNHPLLQAAALLGLLVAVGGVLLWFLTTRLLRQRRTA